MTDETVDTSEGPIRRGRRREDTGSPRRMNIPRTRPLLDFNNFTIDENNAMLDKMVIRFEHHLFRISPLFTAENRPRLLRAFLELLSGRDSELSVEALEEGIHYQPASVFNRPQGNNPSSSITKNGDLILKSSKLSFRRTRHEHTYNLIIDVRINPTRFIVHSIPYIRSIDKFVETRTDKREQTRRVTLDRKDNYLIGNYRGFQNFLRDDPPTGSRSSFLSLMEEVTGWFEGQINKRTARNFYQVEYNWDRWSVSQGEVYYEFFSENAFSTMRRIAYFIPVIYNDARFRQYRERTVHPFETHQTHSSFSVHVKLRGTLKLVIYPKTRNNIRFELRNFRSLRTELVHMDLMLSPEEEAVLANITDDNERDRWKRNYVSTEIEGLAHIMRIAAHHLALIIERIVTVVSEHPEEEQEIALIPRFIRFLYDNIEDTRLVEAVWSSLAVNGFVDLSNFPTISSSIVQAEEFGTYLIRNRNRLIPLPALSVLLIALRQDQNIGLLE